MLKNFIKKHIFTPYSKNLISKLTNYVSMEEFQQSLKKQGWWSIIPHLYTHKITIMSFKKGPVQHYSVYNHQTNKLESVAKYSNTIKDFQQLIQVLNNLHNLTKDSKVAIHLVVNLKETPTIEFTEEKVGTALFNQLPITTTFKDYQVLNIFLGKYLLSLGESQNLCVAEDLPQLLDFKLDSEEDFKQIEKHFPVTTHFTGFSLDTANPNVCFFTHTPKKHERKSKKSNKQSGVSHS